MIRIGDRVSFLNDKITGIVIDIKNKYTAIVETDDGFEVPHPIDQLVALKVNGLKIENNELGLNYERTTDIIKLILLPEFNVISDSSCFNLWIINDTNNLFMGIISRDHKGLRGYLNDFRIGGYERKKLHSFSRTDARFMNFLFIDGLLFSKDIFLANARIDFSVNMKRYDLEDELSFSFQDIFSKIGIDFLIHDENAKNRILSEQKNEISYWEKDTSTHNRNELSIKPSNKYTKEQHEKEIDLHIEALIENYGGMSKVEILEYQVFRMKTELEKAIGSRLKKVVFIHGIGNGRLKSEIVKHLKTYKKIEFQDASYQKYGFGATEVLIK